jgi:hypothetical protein
VSSSKAHTTDNAARLFRSPRSASIHDARTGAARGVAARTVLSPAGRDWAETVWAPASSARALRARGPRCGSSSVREPFEALHIGRTASTEPRLRTVVQSTSAPSRLHGGPRRPTGCARRAYASRRASPRAHRWACGRASNSPCSGADDVTNLARVNRRVHVSEQQNQREKTVTLKRSGKRREECAIIGACGPAHWITGTRSCQCAFL